MNNFKNFVTIATVIFLTGCVSNQSFYLKVDSVNGFTLLSYEDFYVETNSENLSPEVNPILKLFFAKSLIELEITPLEIFSNTEIV